MERVAWLLNDVMFEQNVSYCELARRTGVHRNTISTWHAHPERMRLGDLKKLLDALNVEWNWFWDMATDGGTDE